MANTKKTVITDEIKEAAKATGAKAAETVKEAGKTVKAVADATTEAAKNAGKKVAETAKAAEKTVKKTVKKATDKKTELVTEVYVQFAGQEAKVEAVVAKATEIYVADGHRASSIKSLQIYLKPEESAAYYVINQKYAGRVDLF